jgi:hypothetical protein
VILLADASVEGEEIAAALRARGFAVVDVPLGMIESRVVSEVPRILVVDVDQPGAIATVKAARVLRADDLEVLCVGDPLRAAELPDVSLLESVFERPVDVARLVDRITSLASPAGPGYARRGTTPPPMYAPRPSVPPAADSIPPVSQLSISDDPLELGAFIDPGEGSFAAGLLLEPVALSPELSRKIAEAEERVRSTLDRRSSSPAPSDDDSVLSPETLAILDEPLDAFEENVGTGLEGTGGRAPGADGTGSIRLSPAAMTPIPRASSSSSGIDAGDGAPIGTSANLGSGTHLGSSAPVAAGTQATSRRSPFEQGRGQVSGTPPPSRVATGVGTPEPVRVSTAAESVQPSVLASSPPVLLHTLGPGELFEAPAQPLAPTEMPGQPDGLFTAPPLSPPVRFREPRDIAEGRAFDRHAVQATQDDGPVLVIPSIPMPASGTARDSGPPIMTMQPASAALSRPRTSVATSAPARRESTAMPVVFGAAEGLKPLARAIAGRMTGTLSLTTNTGVRRIVLSEGDVVTATSEIADETLVAFLVSRGDIDRAVAARMAGKLPPSGRHAGAALIAQGHLAQDDLWPVLRAHAEWLVGRAMASGPGTVDIEDEPNGRLKLEPGVFGGSTGAEVFVETARRVLAPQHSLVALGGPSARLDSGSRPALLSECALSDEERAAALGAAGKTVEEVCPDPSAEIVSVVRALVELDVLAVHAPAPRPKVAPRDVPDPIDDEAVRARVRARVALVREGDYFSLLGVGRGATSYEIKRAYLDLRRSLEPSRLLTAKTADLHADVTLILEVLDEAYEILREEPRRERYRRAIEAGPPVD